MVDGNKTVVLFPPEDSAYLYPYPDIPTKSQLDPLRTDWSTTFPNLDKTHPMYAYLTPGDLLYLPKLWWHWLESTTSTTSLNWWHYPPLWDSYLIPRARKQLTTRTTPPTTTTHSAEHVDQLTRDLHEYRFLLHNPQRLRRYLVASGGAQFCRSWFSLVGGFVEKMLQPHKAPHRVNRLYCPRNTLVYIGSTHAESVLRLKSDEERRQWNRTVVEGVGAQVPSCDRHRDAVMLNVPVFRGMLLKETQQLIDKSMGQVLKEQETYDYLAHALELLVEAMPERRLL